MHAISVWSDIKGTPDSFWRVESTWRRKEEEKILASVAENPSRSAGLLQGTFSACLSVAALHVGLHSVG
jgi:hypothetical protein